MIFHSILLLLWAAVTLAADWSGWPDETLFDQTNGAIETGKKRWKQMQSSITQGKDDAPAMKWCDVNNGWSPRFKQPATAGGISQRLNDFINAAQLGVDISGSNFLEIITSFPNNRVSPGDDNSAYYENAYSTKDNVIAVVDINRQGGAGSDVSTLTWATWVKVATDAGTSAGDLSQLIHYTCRNTLAEYVSVDIFGDELDQPTFYSFTPGDDSDNPSPQNAPFYALLGLDNGTGAKNIAINYQKTLGYKTLKSIVAWRENGADNIMGVAYQYG